MVMQLADDCRVLFARQQNDGRRCGRRYGWVRRRSQPAGDERRETISGVFKS